MGKRLLVILLAFTIGIIFIAGNLSVLSAQESTTQGSKTQKSTTKKSKAKESEKNQFTLQEITVTAEKRAENEQKVPIAMQTINPTEMAQLGKTTLSSMLEDIPDAVIQRYPDGLRVTLRGMSDTASTFHNQSMSSPTVAINVDGVFSNRKDQGSDLYDVQRVEVLYGPQSTMYASNTPGGIVNIISADPKLDKFSVRGTLEGGNYNLIHAEGSVNVPISSTVALRGAFSAIKHSGYLSNGGSDQDTKSGRIKLLYKPSGKLSFVATAEVSKDGGHGNFSAAVNEFVKQSDVKDPWTSSALIGSPQDITNKRYTLHMDWNLGFADLTFIPSYSKRDGTQDQMVTSGGAEQGGSGAGVTAEDKTTMWNEEKSAQLRLVSASDFFMKWIVGADWYKSEDYMGMVEYLQGLYDGKWRKNQNNQEQKSIFANVTYPLTKRFRVTGGYRLNWSTLSNYQIEVSQPGQPVTPSSAQPQNYDAKPDYRLGVEYDLGTGSMLYADYNTSFMAQAMSGGGPPGGTTSTKAAPPQKLDSYSIGAKNRFLNNRLQVNASAFYNKYKNFPAANMVTVWTGSGNPYDTTLYPNGPESDLVTGDPNSSTYGDGHMYGIDVSTDFLLTESDRVDLSVSYLKSVWTNLDFNYEYHWQVIGYMPPPPGQGATTVIPVTVEPLSPDNYDGKPMTNSPEWTVNLTYRHDFALWNGGHIKAQIMGRYKSAFRMTWKDADYPYNYQEAFTKWNVSATYIAPSGKWTLAGYVRNVFNYAEKVGYMGDPINQMMIGDPRLIGGVLTVRY